MDLNNLLADDDAVSPVIGVILMVAITVILAAVIGTFVLGLGDQVQSTSPNAQISTSQNLVEISDGSDSANFKEVTLSHDGGDTLDETNVDVTVNGNQAYGVDSGAFQALWTGNGDIGAGSSVAVVASNSTDMDGTSYVVSSGGDLKTDSGASTGDTSLSSGDVIRVTWSSESGDSSSTLREYEVN